MSKESLEKVMDSLTSRGELYLKKDNGKVACFACGHRCTIGEGKRGICKVRFNMGNELRVPHGYVASLQVDPIEKKPFFHVLPGTGALSFGMLGCDYHCSFCQNWISSQALREPKAILSLREIGSDDIVELAVRKKARSVISTYNEPLITSEWASEIFKKAKGKGLITGYVSNGNGTTEVLDYLRPHTDLFKIDLKGFDESRYRELGGVLDHVLRTIEGAFKKGFWVEVVTLVVPRFNDSASELREIARFIAGVSKEIPWHVTAFHSDYKMTDRPSTSVADLVKAYDIGKEEGLDFVYCGNIPGDVGGRENTYCPSCNGPLVERTGFYVGHVAIKEGKCQGCCHTIPGVWQYTQRHNSPSPLLS